MVKYGLLIQDESGDQVQFDYDQETDAKNMTVMVRDIDGTASVPININIKDLNVLLAFLDHARAEMMEALKND